MESKMNKESDQNATSSTNNNSSRSRSKDGTQRSRNIRLPTPPPDPTTINLNENTQNSQQNFMESSTPQIDIDDAMNKESELLEYILSLSSQKSPTTSEGDGKQPQFIRTNSLFSQAIAADEAFDHLDKLYKLMEQLLNLREQNSKLQKRVRDLEHLKKLQDMNLKINFNPNDKIILQDLEADPGYAESLLDNILAAGRNASQKRNSKYKPTRLRQSILGRPQERSCSVVMDDNYSPYHNNLFTYSDGNIYSTNKSSSCISKPAKVSKWKKVKAAFKWEKASSTVGGGNLPVTKSQDSGLGLPIINNEVAKYLRVPSITAAGHSGGSSGGGVSPADSVLSGQSSPGGIRTSGKDLSISIPETPASLSSASSMEDIQNHEVDVSKLVQNHFSSLDFNSFLPLRTSYNDRIKNKMRNIINQSDLVSYKYKSHKDVSIEKSNRQRFSTCSDEDSLQDQRRSKSFDEDTILGKDEDNIYYTKHWNYKMHKTPWGKVKDIIQTRKDSLKKSRVRINSKAMDDNNMNSDHGVLSNRTHRRSESNIDVCSFSSEEFPEVFESPPIDPVTMNFDSIQRRNSTNVSNDNSGNLQSLQTKRQTPLLTVTISNSEVDKANKALEISSTSDKKNNLPPEVVQRYQDIIRAEKIRPSYRYNSRWHRVKKAFLNKNVDTSFRNIEYKSLSTPASPTRHSSFFSEDSDSNSALKDYFTYHTTRNKSPQSMSSQRHIQEEIQKNYEELQNKLSLEFQEKMLEWERLKAATTTCSSQNQNVYALQNTNATSNVNEFEDSQTNAEVESARKVEDFDNRIKPRSPNSSKFKENSTSPITSSDNLSAEFKKKLQEWQRIKKEQSTSQGQSTPTNLQHSASTKKRITDNFQFFKAGATPRVEDSKTFRYPDTKQLSEDFLKKLEEWKHMKATNTVPSYSGYRDEDDENLKHYTEAKPSSPGFKRKETSLGLKSPRQSAKKSKFHEHKELQILEKEIQKIEREKQRLEREREKYLEREERLVKLRRSIGGHQAKKEVLVQTSTGFFRFQGISRKFTQRLYEWEKARGIGPEESTLTLLSPSYKSVLPGSNTRKAEDINHRKDKFSYCIESQSQGRLVRSKSMDSVANLTSNQMTTSMTHQPSSLSLNDMEELEAECLAEAHVDSIPEHLPDIDTFEEPEAVIVDVEAVEEETAAPLEENIAIPVCVTHTPVYRYEQQQDERLCEGEECLAPKVQGGDSTKTQSSYHLIEENITLLNKLKDKEEICKQLESDIEDIEGEMNDLEKTHNELELDSDSENAKKKQSKLQELERKKRRLRNEGVNLHNSFTEHKAQQTLIAQHLVGSMRRLQEINTSVALNVPKKEISNSNQQLMDVTEMVQDLSSELLLLAEKLQSFLNQRNNESVKTKNHGGKKLTREKQWRSVDLATESTTTVRKTRENSADAVELANMLTNKILEMKRGLSYICAASDLTSPRPNKKTVKRKKYNSTSNETLSTNKDKILIEKSDSVPNVTLSRKCELKSEVKRKTRTRSKNDLKFSESDDDNFDESTKKSNRQHRSHRKSTEESISSNKSLGSLNQNISEVPIKNVLVDTNPQFVKYENNFRSNSPVDVLVKTTKTVFLPEDSSFESKKLSKEPYNQILPPTNENDSNTSHVINKDIQNDSIFQIKKDMSPIQSPTSLLQRRLFKSRTCSMACEENFPSTSNKRDLENSVTENLTDPPRNLLRKTLSSDAVASSLPPLPHSPTPLRRDRGLAKETAPSIRLMIARYNQRLYEQDGGRSPGGSSGSGSPVAWRSPVLERRVRAQTEKYQEEIKRILQQGSWKKNEIKKSASVGYIQTTVVPPKKPQTSMEAFVKISEIPDTPPSQRKLRGILKSSSAGSLKIDNQAKEIISNNSKLTELSKNDDKKSEQKLEKDPIAVEKSENVAKASMHVRSLSVTNTPPKIVRKYDMRSVSPKVSISSSPESTQNSPNSLRALKIQRAKEDFLARQISSPEFSTPKSESSLEEDSKKQNRCHFEVNYVTVPHRLSQVSCGSESSCDNPKPDGILIKSASAGMINIDANTYRQLAASEMHSQGYVSLPRSNRSHKDILGGKFGISSITSKFRKVKMRRHKDKDASKLNTISMLCRQSLFVDINDHSGELLNNTNNIPSTNQDYPPVERARSKSTSSSPAFQRHLSDTNKSSSTSGAKSKIFKSKQ